MDKWSDAELQDILAEVARRAAIDPEFRLQAINNAALAVSRITKKALPPDIQLKFVDNSGPVKTIPLPDPVTDISAEELTENELEVVAGGIDWSGGIGVGGHPKPPKVPTPPKPPSSPS
jgi:hypothetical protein